MKSTKVSRSSYITGTNLSQHHGKDTWIFDTAATSHFCCRKNSLQNFQPVNNMRLTVAVGGVTCEIKGIGTVSMIFQSEGGSEIVDFKNVLYFSKLQRNLISGSLIDKAGSNFICKNGKINVYDKYGQNVFTAKTVNGLYCVKLKIVTSHFIRM
ncbi:retrovirus-related Pol polyprotein from transposon TNT 1-94 [Trichonephila clavata]|uniref:Retrovirus-related Pol polyprotein from transposon TNT 1-94 n=1 Tax=Trichonephila clavata TaxID=2740835 RepID=A0A8X6J9C1_TRICU|nr:retrovirus-related Pol polyprotein from transposon TNT 1-94 [Trichonephila clavata]